MSGRSWRRTDRQRRGRRQIRLSKGRWALWIAMIDFRLLFAVSSRSFMAPPSFLEAASFLETAFFLETL